MTLVGAEGYEAITVTINSLETEQLRASSGTVTAMEVEAVLGGETIRMHLVGRRMNQSEWHGTAAMLSDTDSVVRSLQNGLAYTETVLAEVNCLVVVIDHEGRIRRCNKLCEETFGYSEAQVLGQPAFDFIPQGFQREQSREKVAEIFQKLVPFEMERPVVTLRGERLIRWRNKLVRSGSGPDEWHLISAGTDITEERAAQKKLLALAHIDQLTGLPNRLSIQETIQNQIAQQPDQAFSIMMLDLNGFAKVNYLYGHAVGDQLLERARDVILSCLRECDLLARSGGDAFLVLLGGGAGTESAERVAARILARMKEPFDLGSGLVYADFKIGISTYPDHGSTATELIRNADTAKYVAKENGGRTFLTFEKDMHARVEEHIWLDTHLRAAMAKFELDLYYQPKVCLTTGQTRSVEALLRWRSPERGMISPAAFIPYAEESGLIIQLGKWVIREAAAQAYKWQKSGLNLRIAVNISARQLCHTTLMEDFTNALLDNRLAPSLLDIELTESCLAEDETLALERIERFRQLGAQIHLDDFGTGYSSLSRLARLPLDVVKLDRSFISSSIEDNRSRALVCSMVSAAQSLGLKTIAEGVETADQTEFLRNIGVDYVQGFLFAKPMTADDLEVWYACRHQGAFPDAGRAVKVS